MSYEKGLKLNLVNNAETLDKASQINSATLHSNN